MADIILTTPVARADVTKITPTGGDIQVAFDAANVTAKITKATLYFTEGIGNYVMELSEADLTAASINTNITLTGFGGLVKAKIVAAGNKLDIFKV